ncbi:Immunoglobulin domain-containing protein [Acanthopleuribacter pedis]
MINGNAVICAGDTNVVFTVPTVATATGYSWSVPDDAVITGGQGTHEITVTFGAAGGPVSVAAENACGPGQAFSLDVALLPDVTVDVGPATLLVCPGDPVTLIASIADVKDLNYQWFKDEVLLEGEAEGSLRLAGIDLAQEGAYHCTVTAPRGTFVSTATNLTIDALQRVSLTPRDQIARTEPLIFDLRLAFSFQNMRVAWTATPATTLIEDGPRVTMDPPPTETTLLEMVLSDDTTGNQATDFVWILVAANTGFEDYNDDGCSNTQDLWDLAQFWNQDFAGDPSGDGKITVLDFLFVRMTDPTPCP